ncbi:hypothetical protein [Paraburkholderia sp. J12]|uniref:hypothetical protein n=1 Tax=Paraburkholderia sp. J12 TaxID=2805432 RepID=UPI002ABD840F|nr:hypothetical protein [Paraburkholderia sp. J12]
MKELTVDEINQVGGGDAVHAGMFYTGLLGAIAGGALVASGLGIPIAIGGAALAAEGGGLMTLSFF